jgi:hypothetical protein
MAISVVISAHASFASGGTSQTLAIDCTGCDFLLALPGWRNNGPQNITGITYAGAAMTSKFNINDNSIFFGGGIAGFYKAVPATGSNNCVVSFDAALTGNSLILVGLTGVDTFNGAHVPADRDAGQANVSATISSAVSNLVIAVAAFKGGTDIAATITGGQTTITTEAGGGAGNDQIEMECSYEAGAASVTCSYSYTPTSTYDAGIVLLDLVPSAGGGGSNSIAWIRA